MLKKSVWRKCKSAKILRCMYTSITKITVRIVRLNELMEKYYIYDDKTE